MGFLEERDLSDVPTIPEFYKGKTIFITGGTGFIGKILIEKLLYSCSELNRIYLLIRRKKNENPEERLDKLQAIPCFSRIPPGVFKSKVFLVSGDVMEPGLGLSAADRAILVNEVNIIFHSAASVRFDDTLKFAIQMNLKGTIEVLALAKEAKDLCAFVHVSTSYSNTNRNPIEEVLYPPLADWRDTLAVCKAVDDYTLNILTAKYLGEMPNTYTFSKQLTEHVVSEHRGQLPIVIVRPSIVISSLAEPIPGWIDNFNGPVGICIASGKGIMRIIHLKPEIMLDCMPVDSCVRHIAAAAWIRGTKKLEPTEDVPIYNCCSGDIAGISLGEFVEVSKKIALEVPFNDQLWSVGGQITSYETVYYFKVIVQHLLPAILVDTLLRIAGRKPMLVKIQRRIFTAGIALRYYLTQQWKFDHKNFIALRSSLKEEDRESFYSRLEDEDIPKYLIDSAYGARKFLLKEKDEDLPRARAHAKRMMIVDKIFKLVFYGAIFYWMLQKVIQYYDTSI